MRIQILAAAVAVVCGIGIAPSAAAQVSPMTPDITGKKFVAPEPARDFIKREVMIPMRDGVKLYTVIMIRGRLYPRVPGRARQVRLRR